MQFLLSPWHIVFAVLCGWVNDRQQRIIEFQNAQIEALLEKLGKKRVLLTDRQRCVLAVKGRALGRQTLHELTTIVTPDTILRWHRQLVAKKWSRGGKRPAVGRPRIRQAVVDAILRFAKENSTWGYDRIQGALSNVGYDVSDSTVAKVLQSHGIQPAPDRRRTQSWSSFLKAHWDTMFATDLTTVEVWTTRGLTTFYVWAVMHLQTRRVHIAGITTNPHTAWMKQICRNLTDCEDGFLKDASHVIVDRDTSFRPLRQYLKENTETKVVLLPPKSPNLNSFIERWFRSLKSEALNRVILFGERALERAVRAFVAHYDLTTDYSSSDSPGNSRVSWSGLRDMPLFRRRPIFSTTCFASAVVK